MGRMVAATAATVGLGLSLTGSLLRLPRLPDLVAVPPTLADHLPRLRRELDRRLGPEGTDVLFGFVNAATAALDAVADGGGRGGRYPHDAGGRGVERSADVVSA